MIHQDGLLIETVEKKRQDAENKKFQNACRIWFCPADDKIAKDLRQLTQVEREKVWADLSGNEKNSLFKKEIVEDPKEIENAMNEMQQEIDNVKNESKSALNLAVEQSQEYVNDHSFRLMFLRSCEYDAFKAAHKLIEHMETKRRLFGDDVLGRDLEHGDLSENDMTTLGSGGIQLLDERDSANRVVLYGHMESLKFKERENLSRALFYSFMTALKDETIQKLGVVVVWNMMSEYAGGFDYEADRLANQAVGAVPIRLVARYLLYESPLWHQVIDVLNHFVAPCMRLRTRSIQGSHGEVMYSLMCLGIPCRSIPVDSDDQMSLPNLYRCIAGHNQKESCDWDIPLSSDSSEQSTTVPPAAKRRRLCAP